MTVYEADRLLRRGRLSLTKTMLSEFVKSRELGYRLFSRDFTAKYRQSLLGILWIVLMPLFTVGVFVAVNRAGILKIAPISVPYPLFALFGLTLWSLSTGMITAISNVVGQTGGLVTKINFPRIALVYSPVLTTLLDFFIRLILVLIAMLYFNYLPPLSALWLPILLIPLMLMSVGIGLFLAVLGAVFKDIANFLSMFFGVALFLTPVMYPLPEIGIVRDINAMNPLYYFIELPRAVFFGQDHPDIAVFCLFTALSAAVFAAGWRFFHISMQRIVEKI